MRSVDVIVPCYCYGRFLRECVSSVLMQDSVDVRVLVLDDASPDDTPTIGQKLATEDSRITFRRAEVNQGHIATFNQGLEWASSDYLLLLSADDYLLPGALDKSVSLLEKHPDLSFTYGDIVVLDQDSGKTSIAINEAIASEADFKILGGEEFIALSGPRNIVPASTVVVRTELQKKVGAYSADLPHTADMEMWLRLAVFGRVGVIFENLAVYRRHGRNMSLHYTQESGLLDLIERKAAFQKFIENCGHQLVASDATHNEFLRLLARDAIGFASTAINNQQFDALNGLSDFAVQLSPGIKRSPAWLKLKLKRLILYNAWRLIHQVEQRRA